MISKGNTGKVYRIVDKDTGIIVDELGTKYFYGNADVITDDNLEVGDLVNFKAITKVVNGFSIGKAIFVTKFEKEKEKKSYTV